MKRLLGLFAACVAAFGGTASAEDRIVENETVTLAAEADLGADVTRVLLRSGGELEFTKSLWGAKTSAVDVREGATYRATGAHCPMGPLELTGGTLVLPATGNSADPSPECSAPGPSQATRPRLPRC